MEVGAQRTRKCYRFRRECRLRCLFEKNGLARGDVKKIFASVNCLIQIQNAARHSRGMDAPIVRCPGGGRESPRSLRPRARVDRTKRREPCTLSSLTLRTVPAVGIACRAPRVLPSAGLAPRVAASCWDLPRRTRPASPRPETPSTGRTGLILRRTCLRPRQRFWPPDVAAFFLMSDSSRSHAFWG